MLFVALIILLAGCGGRDTPEEVNHQYSKSLAFETAAARVIDSYLPGFRYFSLLRPLSELAIAALFSELPEYLEVFRSCNTAFRQSPDERGAQWCLDCPKCRFVFLILAPFVERAELLRTFGGNPLADPAQRQGYAALLGLTDHLPWECVGEVEESLAALAWLSRAPGWRQDAVVRHFSERLADRLPQAAQLLRRALVPSADHSIPGAFMAVVGALGQRLAVRRREILASLEAL